MPVDVGSQFGSREIVSNANFRAISTASLPCARPRLSATPRSGRTGPRAPAMALTGCDLPGWQGRHGPDRHADERALPARMLMRCSAYR